MSVAVIGAGMVGLVCALRLAERGTAVTVYERDTVPGGLAAGFVPHPGGDSLERFYHHIFRSDTHMVALIEELGLTERLLWAKAETTCFHRGTFARLDGPKSLLAFAPLAPLARIRLAAALAALKLAPTAAPFERLRAAAFLRAIAGTQAYAVVFEPLFRAKFGDRAESISLAWFWARIHDRTASLGYLRGGFAALYDGLVERIRAAGGTVRFSTEVAGIERVGEHTHVRTGGETAVFDHAIATLPLRALAPLAPQLSANFLARYTPARGLAARCVVMALDRPLTGSYWINVCETDAPFMVVVEQTRLIPPERYGGDHLVYLGNYGPHFSAEDPRELIARHLAFLQRLNPAFSLAWVRDAWSFRAEDAQPIVTPDYARSIAPHATNVPGLSLANLYQVYPHDRGQNYAVEMGERVAEMTARRMPVKKR